MNVIVTAVGSGLGQSIMKALQNTEYGVIGINSELLGVGLYAAQKSYLGPCANDPGFVDKLIEICVKEDCHIIFPGHDFELIPFSKNIEKFKKNGVLPIVSDSKVVEICGDKLETVNFLKNNNFPSPLTYKLSDYSFELDFPLILKKKKQGYASFGQFLVKDRNEFDTITSSVDVNNYVVQEYIDGEEYTCGTVSFDHHCIGTILMKRQIRFGATWQAFVVKDKKLSDFVEKVINSLKPFGACNVQLRLRNNVPYIFEINARCSGTTSIRAQAGFNEPKMICDYVLKGVRNPTYKIKKNVFLRYSKDLAVSYKKIKEMSSMGHVQNKRVRL
jgi:carbamoyl-phosphate synthase large subunit